MAVGHSAACISCLLPRKQTISTLAIVFLHRSIYSPPTLLSHTYTLSCRVCVCVCVASSSMIGLESTNTYTQNECGFVKVSSTRRASVNYKSPNEYTMCRKIKVAKQTKKRPTVFRPYSHPSTYKL
jgi:hypothetical protein